MTKRFIRPLLAIVFLFVSCVPLWSQTTGRIRGQVTDSNGSALPGAVVNAVNEASGAARSTVSNENGTYIFAGMSIATYKITATMPGFKTKRHDRIRVSINGSATANFQLTSDSIAEEMVVAGETPILDVSSASVGTNFTAEFMEDMPTRRNFWDMIAMTPGVSQTNEGTSATLAFGSDQTSNAWHVDGLDVTGTETGNAWGEDR